MNLTIDQILKEYFDINPKSLDYNYESKFPVESTKKVIVAKKFIQVYWHEHCVNRNLDYEELKEIILNDQVC